MTYVPYQVLLYCTLVRSSSLLSPPCLLLTYYLLLLAPRMEVCVCACVCVKEVNARMLFGGGGGAGRGVVDEGAFRSRFLGVCNVGW